MNWKLFAIIAATAVATAAAVVFLMQKQNEKHKRIFNSEFDDDDFYNYNGYGEQCRQPHDEFSIDIPDIPDDIDEGEPVEDVSEETTAPEETETEDKE